ncbi:sugar nucleotide-binding protein [Nonomuraea sp. NPDC050790]|uniref:sugar nucleotide-binding protein n=1 Tax=Nonomuraea sp. NPDC050790 TaxID=3364371 RepID=UPI00378E3685
MKIIVVGGSGFLGREVARQAVAGGHQVAATCMTRPGQVPGVEWLELDVRDPDAVARRIGGYGPDVVVNAAYRPADWKVTAVGAAHVATAVAASGGLLVHVSSDAVFSGEAAGYAEDAVPDPISPYGAAKAAAEVAVRAIVPAAAIVRTSLIVGDGDSSHEAFVHTLAEGGKGVLFTDDVRCPVHVADLAAALLELYDQAGIHHAAGADAVSRHELGRLVARRDGLDPACLPSGRRTDTNLRGPLEVRLDCHRTQARLRTRLRGAHEFLR